MAEGEFITVKDLIIRLLDCEMDWEIKIADEHGVYEHKKKIIAVVRMITPKEKKFLIKVWKKGSFRSYDFVGVKDQIDRLERIGVLIKTGSFDYKIDRERFVEIESKEIHQKPTKQTRLFGS